MRQNKGVVEALVFVAFLIVAIHPAVASTNIKVAMERLVVPRVIALEPAGSVHHIAHDVIVRRPAISTRFKVSRQAGAPPDTACQSGQIAHYSDQTTFVSLENV